MGALGFLGPLASVLGFTAPLEKGGAIGIKSYQDAQQEQANLTGFGKALDALPANPEYDLLRQAYKSGMSPEAISGLLKGPVGEAFQQQVQQQKWKDFVGPKGLQGLTPDRVWEGVGQGIFSPEEGLHFQQDFEKHQAEMAKINASGQKLSSNFNTYLATQGLTQQDLQGMSQPDRDKLTKGFEQMYNMGPGATTLKTVHNFQTGNDEITAVPAHPESGQVVGYGRPPAGGNPIAILNSAQMGMHRLEDLMKPLGDSNVPMLLPAEMQKRGMKPPEGYAAVQDQIGQTFAAISTMIMRAGGFRNPQVAQEWMGTHVPKATDSPALINSKLHEWFTPGGLMDQYRTALGQNMLLVPTKGGGLVSGGPDPFATAPGTSGAPGAGGAPPSDLEDLD